MSQKLRLGKVSQRYVARRVADKLPIKLGQVQLGKDQYTDLSFVDYVGAVNKSYQWYAYLRILADLLTKILTGEIKRLIVFMPPRHGKSELISRLFTAYYLLKHPERWVGICSYGGGLSNSFSRVARSNYAKGGGLLHPNSQAVSLWETLNGGGLWAAGVGGSITGMGAHLVVLDDPVKNAEEAASPAIQLRNQAWYGSTLYTRLEPDAAIVLVMTRWSDADLGSYILELEELEPEGWHVVLFPAVAEELHLAELYDSRPAWLDTCHLVPDYREVGQPLSPERYPLEKLTQIQSKVGEYYWRSLYQQQPAQQMGAQFKRAWFEIHDQMPKRQGASYTMARYWDKAGTADGGAYTVGVLMARMAWHENGKALELFYVCDMIMGQWDEADREAHIKQASHMDLVEWVDAYDAEYTVYVEQEPGSGGKESAKNTIKNMAGFAVEADRPTGDKKLRARPLEAQAKVGQVKLVRGKWNSLWLFHMSRFPHGQVKDVTDASSGAFNKLALEIDDLAGVG